MIVEYILYAYMQGLATGTGTQEDPFLISNVGKLQQISSKHTATTNHNYRLICDIATTQDMATMSTYMQTQNHEWFNKGFAVVDWAPIADFAGTLSGKYGENNAYEIKDLSTTKSVAEWAIFGALTKAKISDLEITYSQNLELNAKKLSGLAGAVSDSTIDNITINASKVATTAVDSVTLSALVGEVKVGEEKTEISNIKIKTSTFDAESARSATIGGLIATMEVGAETSLSSVVFENALTITTKGSGTNVAGGLVGSAQSLEGADVTLDNVTIKSIGEGQSILGGVFGKAEELSEFSAKAGTVVLESSSISPNANTIGGFAGSMVSSVVEGDSSITGVTITFNGSGLLYAGGVAGEDANSTINNFAPAADITNNQGSQSHVGGLVGDATGTEIHASGQDQSGLDLESFSFTIVKPEGALATTAMSVGGVVGFGHSGTTLGTSLKVKNTFEHDIDFADELYLGGLAGNLDGAKVQGANIEKVKLEGIHVGAVAGKVANSTIFASNITSPQITAMFSSDNVSYAGAVAGQMVASTISGTNVTTEGNAGFVKTADAPTEEVKNPEGETVLQKLSATTYIGGFAGHMTDKCVIDQNSTSSISISCQTAGFVGGMVGKADDLSVSGAQISGNINAGLDQEFAAETLYVGGLAGEAKGTFINVTYRGKVSEISAFMAKVQDPKVAVGGIVGHSTKATFEGIAVEGATVQGTYVAGGILGSGSEITFQGTASINPTGQKSYYSNTVNQTTTVAAASTVQPANGEYPSVATTYAGGIVGRLEGTENTISACQSLAKVQSGWSKINTLLQQRDFFYYDQSGDDEGRQDYTKRKLSEKIDAVNSGSVGTDKSYAGGIVGFAESLTIEKVDNKGAVEAKARTSLVINTANVFEGDLLAGGANYDSYSHYGFENSDAFATGIGYLQNGTLGENCTNAGVITGGQKLEFNIFTTDGGANDNIYKSYLLDYGFTYENGNKIDIQNSFEGLYEDDPFGANAWLDAQSQGLRLVASENATGDMAKYTNGTAYPPMADTVDADKYVLVSDWNNTSSTPVYTNMHYGQYVDGYYLSRSTDAGQSPLSGILFPDGLTLEKHSPTASFKAPAYYFIYTLWNNDVRYMTGPYQHIFEETGKDPENPDNDVTLYYYYNITQNSNGTYSVGSKVTPEYGTAAYDNLKARALSNKYTINPTTVNTYNLGFIGDKCNFPTANNIDTQSNCFILSNQDGEVYISNPNFTLSTSQPKLINLMVISSASSIKGIELPNPQPYDDFNPVDEELTTGAVKVWTNDTTIELDGTTHTALNGPVEFIYPAYNETYDDKGKEIWFATWVDATDTRRYTILHWVGDELKLVNQIPEGYVTSQTIPVGPEGKYVEGQTFNVTYRIFKYKPASTE